MKKILFSLFVLLSIQSFSQVVLEKELQKASDKKLGVINNLGMKSFFGGLGEVSNTLVGKFEVTKLKNNGSIIRLGNTFTKYDENMNKEWSTEYPFPITGSALPSNISLGDESGFYFIMEREYSKPEGFYVTKFDNATGKYIQQKYAIAVSNQIVASYLTSTGLNIINFQYDKNEDKITYKLISFSKTLGVTEKVLDLKTDTFEKENFYGKPVYAWRQIKILEDKVILKKDYYKKEKEEKNEQGRYIIKTAEVDFSGNVSNEKNIVSDMKGNRKSPTIEISDDGKVLYSFGYLNIKNNIYADGLYIHKIDYKTSEYIFKKEIDFTNVVNSIEIEKSPMNANEMYPVFNFIEGSYEFNNNNGELNFMLRKSQASGISNMSVYSLNVDSTGAVTSLYDIKYPANIIMIKRYHYVVGQYVSTADNGGFFFNPISVKKLYSSTRSTVVSPLEYIYEHADENATVNNFWCVRKADNGYLILKISDTTSEIIGYKLK